MAAQQLATADADLVIIGAGYSGIATLIAANSYLKSGAKVRCFESESSVSTHPLVL